MGDEATGGVPSFARRDRLRALEVDIRKKWEETKVFDADPDPSKEKYFITFPFPYMNGRLHIGHLFSISKADFTAGFQKLLGKNVLFPFGFHVTGMPISAAANKIKNEIEQYGCPPVIQDKQEEKPKDQATAIADGPKDFKSKKTKTTRKTGKAMLQWHIMQNMGLSEEEIPEFTEPQKWIDYFTNLGEADLKLCGLHVDWRRSFVTASGNKFFDQFIRWQFLRLRDQGVIDFGRRATIYDVKDKQACADHDRKSGEGVAPQEYTLIKLRVLELPQKVLDANPRLVEKLEAGKVFMVAATLRPETMYGQTNMFVLPSGLYGAYEFQVQPFPGSTEREAQVLICSERSASNMAYQDPFTDPSRFGEIDHIGNIKGSDLVGCPVKSPKAIYERVYCLPLLTISMTKGTGVVTSVPSDSPDDFAALRDWQTDEKLREKHGVTEEMVKGFDVVPIINIPGMGDTSAVFMCDKLNIKSQKDKKKLEEAKGAVYLEGFYKGVMLVGEEDGVKGMKVQDAKEKCKAKLCADGEAFIYYEPEREVISRSDRECVVAYLDQWFIKYGEEGWANKIREHVQDSSRFSAYSRATKKKLLDVIDWLHEWACSRNFGLGTLVPWDEKFVIESLSDSTIYMAYYTIAHLLQGRANDKDYNGLDGKGSPLGILPEQMTPEVFDYIFLQKPYPADCGIDEEKLALMKDSFEYWYPIDLRASGKDLIQNHLTMTLYNHAAIWPDRPEMWPKSYFCNGLVEVEGQKMGKSIGNFIMVHEAITGHRSFELNGKTHMVGWSADATRLALAAGGDLLEDPNFSCDVADKSILRLTNELDWIDQEMSEEKQSEQRKNGKEEFNFWERAFDAQIDLAIRDTKLAYEQMRFRDVVRFGYYDLQGCRDTYRDGCSKQGVAMNTGLIRKYIEVSAVIMSPIIPFFSEYVWTNYLGNSTSVMKAVWPETHLTQEDMAFVRSVSFLHETVRAVRLKIQQEEKKRLKKGNKEKIRRVVLSIATEFPAYHQEMLKFLASEHSEDGFPEDIKKRAKDFCSSNEICKPLTKDCLRITAITLERVNVEGPEIALELSLPFNQAAILESERLFATQAMDVDSFEIRSAEASDGGSTAIPGTPAISFP